MVSEHEQFDAAGHVQLDAGDVGGQVGAEERDRVGDVLRLARALEHRPVGDPLVHRGVRHVESLGADDARDDRVARDPVTTSLHRQRLRQSEQARLRRRVRRLAEPAERAGDGRHVHDPAELPLLHVGPDGLRAVERTGEVHLEIPRPQRRLLIGELPDVVECAGVVDEDVDGSQLVDGARNRSSHLLAVGDVAAHGQRSPSEPADLLGGRLGVHEPLRPRHLCERPVRVRLLGQLGLDEEVGDDDVGAGAGECQRVGAPEPARAAGDERDASGQIDLESHGPRL